jgi:hypothetical protein
MNLKNLVNLAEAHARTIMIEFQMDLVPAWLLVDKHDQVHILGTPWQNNHEKAVAEAKVKAFMRKHEIIKYSFVVEAWEAEALSGTDLEEIPEEQRPRNRADRIETVIACATDNAKAEWRMWRTIRNRKGKVINLKPYRIDSDREPEGWMRDMLAY